MLTVLRVMKIVLSNLEGGGGLSAVFQETMSMRKNNKGVVEYNC